MAKKDFEWSTQQQLGVIDVNERERRLVAFCSLDIEDEDTGEVTETRWYISISTMKFFKKKGEKKEAWNFIKGWTIPFDNWFEVVNLVNENVEFEE